MGWRAVVGAVGLVGVLVTAAPVDATAGDVPVPRDIVEALQREVCSAVWVDAVCEATALPDPGYRATAEPNADQPLVPRIGVVHEHSGYSDGDPATRPSDYFRAGREGHNRADDGGNSGVVVDFLLSSEHSENEKLPVTTAEVCIVPTGIPDALARGYLRGIVPPLQCSNVGQADHYRKWQETLDQARAGSDEDFTALRGFEFTNDIYNHLGVYFSRNVVNAKIDGSYASQDVFWQWLRTPADRGGGDDALVVFNHPGGTPALTPFDGSLPTGQLLALLIEGNWRSYAHVPSVDDKVIGMEVNGGDDLEWYARALRNGWHLGPVAAEDEHQREWSSSADGKTVVLTRGRSPQDYYWAFQQRRMVAVGPDVITGAPGQRAVAPQVRYWADGPSVDAPGAAPLGSRLSGGAHTLELSATGLPAGSQAVLVGRTGAPVALGTAGADGAVRASHAVTAPSTGEDWWFVVICGPDATSCGTDALHDVVTAPIWLRSA